ncbi:MAG: non-specific endonuclease [Ramlibacter sp.]|jgi:endonuclease G|nr:non-specific endonuclease [Ramlibacter sp.]
MRRILWALAAVCALQASAADARQALDFAARAARSLGQSAGWPGAEPNGNCAENYLDGQAPRLMLDQLAQTVRELCSPGYAVLHSGITRTPLWSAEHLHPERIRASIHLSRKKTFRPDHRLPAAERAQLEDYAGSEWDRGHMSPNKDMADRESQKASFLLSNMIPQEPLHNQNLWGSIEHATRGLVLRGESVYVVTGPAFLGDTKRIGRVAIPSHVWKAVFLPGSGRAGAWWTVNRKPTGSRDWEFISIDELVARTGIDPFPALSGPARQRADALTQPRMRARRREMAPD